MARSIQTTAHRGTRPAAGRTLLASTLAVFSLLSAPLARAATIEIDLTTLSAVGLMGTDQVPAVVDEDLSNKLAGLQPTSWAEFPFTVPAGQGGVYTLSGEYGTPNPIPGDLGLPVSINVDVRKAGDGLHYGSQDIVLPPTATDPNDVMAYYTSGTFSAPGLNLAPGDYVLRIRNVSMKHTTISNRSPGYDWRNEISQNAVRRVDLGSLVLTSGAAAPATGTISGKVTSSDLGYAVGGAYVMAVPTGQEVGEPGPFWTAGYWTTTDDGGNYTLTVPAGTSFTVQAGRPDTYEVAGARSENVTVTAGATTTRDLSLKSRWSSTDGEGQLTAELEYFHNKVADSTSTPWTNMNLTTDGNASNQFKVGWTGDNDFLDIYVDVPTGQGGQYDLSAVYNSFPGGVVRFIANPDQADQSAIETELPNSSSDPNNPGNGYWQPTTVKFPDPITLRAGRNVVRGFIVSGGIDFDAIKLEAHVADVPVPGEANPRNANFSYVIGEKEPGGQVAYPEKAGNTITNLYRGSYVEIPMTFATPGIYQAVIPTKAWGPAPFVQLDLLPEFSDDHYATGDVAVPAVNDAFSDTTIANSPVLTAGAYTLRVRNTTQFRTTSATREDFNAYGADPEVYQNGFWPNRLDFGQVLFTQTGPLPSVGTLTGVVKSSAIGGIVVPKAIVMANPAGQEVPEPSIIWQKGFWTMTGADGAYSMPVLAGTYSVQAGQAASYGYQGGAAMATVGSGGSATANIDLPSRVTQDASGHYEINVEAEYFINKPVDSFGGGYAAAVIAFQQNDDAKNGLVLGYTDGGDFIDIPVDVPAGAGGQYTLTDYYFNGYWDGVSKPDGIVSFTANPDELDESSIQDAQPNTSPTSDPAGGYNTPGVKVFGQPITLREGHNIIRMKLESGSSNFDAFKLTSLATFPMRPGALRALSIAAGIEAAPTPASGAPFMALDADGNGRIEVQDAAKLARQGLL